MLDTINRVLRRFDIQLIRPSELWHTVDYLGRQPKWSSTPKTESPLTPRLQVFTDEPLTSAPFDFAVVMTTILRPTIVEALRSVFLQDLPGRVQILVGVDKPLGDIEAIDAACETRPANCMVMVLYPGYSTSTRHGGLHPAIDGGCLRTVLSYLAHSRRIAYLDDDNWWAPRHLSSLAEALSGHEWAYSSRWFVHPKSRVPLCIDKWELVGPSIGTFAHIGGWVDPNCLALDKISCEAVLRWWSIPLRNSLTPTADRNVFRLLRQEFRGRATGLATVYYAVNENDHEQPQRVAAIGPDLYEACGRATSEAERQRPAERSSRMTK